MRLFNISSYTVKRDLLRLFCLLAAGFLIFFITGFIFYTPSEIDGPHASMTMRIERAPEEVLPVPLFKDRAAEEQKGEQCSSAAVRLPSLNERPEKVMMATKYNDLLAQMSLILDDMGSVNVWGAMKDHGGLTCTVETDPAPEDMAEVAPLEKIVRERMGMIEDDLEYASSQMGISLNLLAAVAWAESKMLPYALNVKGKAYYFTSREQALKMLRELDTDNVDIGLLQVNYRLWGEPLGLQKEDLLNSRLCAIIGAMILTYNLQRHRDPWVAIGRYHSGNMRRMKAYQAKVSRGFMLIRILSMTVPQKEETERCRMSQDIRHHPALLREAMLDS